MLDSITKKNIDNCRDILVGKVPDPKSQIEQITLALIYKFMDDMDREAVEVFKGNAKFFSGEYSKYSWRKLFDPSLSGKEMLDLYSDGLEKLETNPNVPELFRNIFKNAYLPYKDPATLKLFLKHIGEFEYSHSEKLGDAFEYLLSVMGSQGDAGQFRTPRHIIDFITSCLNPQKHETVNDPACGTAGFLLSAFKHILNTNTDKRLGDKLTPDDRTKLAQNFVGYDISPDMVRLSLANMYLHGFSTPQVYEYDTLSSEDRWDETFDVILANPPFMTPKGGIRPHKKFGVQANKAEVLFTDYIAEHLNKNGRAGIVVPNGIVATTQTAYKQLRKMLVDDSLIAVISLPAGCFNPYSGVKTSILMLDKSLAKKNDHILFIKVENDGFDLGAQRREHEKNNLPLALEAFNAFKESISSGKSFDEEKYSSICTLVEKDKIVANKDVILSADRYSVGKVSQTEFNIVKLDDIAEIISGQSPESQFYNNKGEGHPFYQGRTDFGEIYLEKPTKWTTHITKEAFKDDILMSVRAPVGPVNISTEKICIGRGLAAIRPNENVSLYYIFYILRSLNGIIKGNGGAVFDSISREQIKELEIPLPPLEIQEQIVKEIIGYQKIIDGAKMVVDNYKPTISVKPDWELVELGEVFKLSSGKFLPTKNKIDGDYNVYGGNGINGTHNEYFLEEPTLVIGRVGEYCGAVHITTPKSWATDNCLYVTNYLENLNQVYLKYALIHANLNQYAKVGGQPSVSQGSIYEVKIPLPIIEVQNEIVQRIEQEQELVTSNKQLIAIFEQKIKDKINEVWGVKEEVE